MIQFVISDYRQHLWWFFAGFPSAVDVGTVMQILGSASLSPRLCRTSCFPSIQLSTICTIRSSFSSGEISLLSFQTLPQELPYSCCRSAIQPVLRLHYLLLLAKPFPERVLVSRSEQDFLSPTLFSWDAELSSLLRWYYMVSYMGCVGDVKRHKIYIMHLVVCENQTLASQTWPGKRLKDNLKLE